MHVVHFPKISGERRQLNDECNTRPLPLYAKGVDTQTRSGT